MLDWYTDFYRAAGQSRAHAVFCQRVYGRDLCQHGFADMAQLHRLLEVTRLKPGGRVLDLGCGNGMIAEYISGTTRARVTGIDNVPTAIRQARERTKRKRHRLDFLVMDIGHLAFAAGAFDAILAIDTLYFTDMADTIRQMKTVLRPGGQMAILYSHGANPSAPKEIFPKETTSPDKTPLAQALNVHGLPYRTWHLTAEDYRQAQRRIPVLADLKDLFVAEGNQFLYENRLGEASGVSAAIEFGAHARYLYNVRLTSSEAEPGTETGNGKLRQGPRSLGRLRGPSLVSHSSRT